MRCYRCKRHGKLVTMVKYGNGTARCPKCGRTIHYEPRKRRRNRESTLPGRSIWFAISLILFGLAAARLNLTKISFVLLAIGGTMLGIIFFIFYKEQD